VSIPSNIAEGASRRTKKEFLQFLYIAKSSLSELDAQFELAEPQGYVFMDHWNALNEDMTDIDKILSGLIRHESKA